MKKSFTYAPNPFRKMPKGTRKLPVSSAVYVVNRDRNGKLIPNKKFLARVKDVEKMFLSLFEGYTNDQINRGEFINKTNGKIMAERVARITSFADVKLFKTNRKKLEAWIKQKKKDWDQEAIAFEFEGDLYYL